MVEQPNESVVKPEPEVEVESIELNKSEDCIIIVGAFGSSANVNKMLRKIEGLGWSGYQDQKSSRLTRVGVQVQCSSLNESLRQVKSKIEPAAWILE